MNKDLFREGGTYRVRRLGGDEYSFSIPIPVDEDGLVGRECPREECSPAYFKVKPGTGITTGQGEAFCPYCRGGADPSDFFTKAQLDYGKRIVEREAIQGVERAMADALGIDPSGKRKLVDGLISVEVSMKPTRLPPVGRPIEEELRRDVTCAHCGLDHAVFGLATWCPDCGRDIFLAHVAAELEVLRNVLRAVDSRRDALGSRVAARDVENTLEDLVSVFETVLKIVTRRHLSSLGRTPDEIESFMQKEIRNSYQSVQRARELLSLHTGALLGRGLSDSDLNALADVLEKRHPIAHNLGIIDRKYLTKVRSGEIGGREVRVTAGEVMRAIDVTESLLRDVYGQLFPSEKGDTG